MRLAAEAKKAAEEEAARVAAEEAAAAEQAAKEAAEAAALAEAPPRRPRPEPLPEPPVDAPAEDVALALAPGVAITARGSITELDAPPARADEDVIEALGAAMEDCAAADSGHRRAAIEPALRHAQAKPKPEDKVAFFLDCPTRCPRRRSATAARRSARSAARSATRFRDCGAARPRAARTAL